MSRFYYFSSLVRYINSDNQAAMKIANNLVQHDRTKHVEIDRHFIKDHLKRKTMELPHVNSKDQLADMLTKAVCGRVFHSSISKLRMIDIHSPAWGGVLTWAVNIGCIFRVYCILLNCPWLPLIVGCIIGSWLYIYSCCCTLRYIEKSEYNSLLSSSVIYNNLHHKTYLPIEWRLEPLHALEASLLLKWLWS